MKRALFATASVASLLWAGTAAPCGGAFGPNAVVSPSQTLVVAHKEGTETYVFRPHFCGESTQFGLILPVPAALSKSPALGNPALFDELDRISAPEVKQQRVCKGDLDGGSAGAAPGDRNSDGVDVINQGQVGIFDWVLVKADSKASFTEWLDSNGFPHAPAADEQFTHYVTEGWSFVAFKVTAGPNAPPAGKKLCGDFGPIELAFPTTTPVVPTRIASVSAGGQSPSWRIYGLSAPAAQLAITSSEYYASTSYSDALSATTLAGAPELAKLGAAGDRLVRLDVSFGFNTLANDLVLTSAAPQQSRAVKTEIEYVDCPAGVTVPPQPGDPVTTGSGSGSGGGCAVTPRSNAKEVAGTTLGALLALALVMRQKKKRRG
jgi:hypothetical protein